MTQLAGKTALITGASSGIGYEAAKLFAAEGAKVVIGARRRQMLDKLVDEIAAAGGQAIAVAGDVTEEGYAKKLVETAVDRFGGLDIAFNNAGTLGALGELTNMQVSDWDAVVETNLKSGFLAARAQIPALLDQGGGSIIFNSTFVGYSAGMPGTCAYAASKAGLIGLTKSLATELGPKRIRVNALLPGGTDTAMAAEMINTPEMRTFIEGLHALKRLADPAEIARSALYLASDASSFVTGTALLCDGGISVNRT
ncbi:MAG: SDR family oxidoreductase [Hyphomicrobiales bacterium]|nr:SDR family oxidoreductase [Hyphomicrobiales bacterium]